MKRKSVTITSDSKVNTNSSSKKQRPISIEKLFNSSSQSSENTINNNNNNSNELKKVDLFRLVEQIAPMSGSEYMFGSTTTTQQDLFETSSNPNNIESSDDDNSEEVELALLSPRKQAMERTKPLRQEVLVACEAIMESLSQTQHHIRTDPNYIPAQELQNLSIVFEWISGLNYISALLSPEASQLTNEQDRYAYAVQVLFTNLMDMKSEINQTSSASQLYALKQGFDRITDYLKRGNLGTNTFSASHSHERLIKFLRKISTNPMKSSKPFILRKSGVRLLGNSKIGISDWKQRQLKLFSDGSLRFYSADETEKLVIEVSDISKLAGDKDQSIDHCFSIHYTTKQGKPKKHLIACLSKYDLCSWLLVIDGVIGQFGGQSRIEKEEKDYRLRWMNTNDTDDGMIVLTSANPVETWHYTKDGRVINAVSDINYIWNGSTFECDQFARLKLGTGRWDGHRLAWYTPNNEIFLEYIWNPDTQTYEHRNESLNWSWTLKHTLISARGVDVGNWKVVGSCPQVVAFFLQMLRYFLLSR